MKQLGAMIVGGYRKAVYHLPVPELDLSYPSNLVNWLRVRRILRGFGLQFDRRVQIMLGFGFSALLICAMYILVRRIVRCRLPVRAGRARLTATLLLAARAPTLPPSSYCPAVAKWSRTASSTQSLVS